MEENNNSDNDTTKNTTNSNTTDSNNSNKMRMFHNFLFLIVGTVR